MRDLFGVETMNRFVEAFAGRTLYVPRRPPAHGPWAEVFTPEELEIVCHVMGGETEPVPLGKAGVRQRVQALVRQLLLDGASTQEIVRKVGVSRRAAQYARARLKAQSEGGGK